MSSLSGLINQERHHARVSAGKLNLEEEGFLVERIIV